MGFMELKSLWVDPDVRGKGIGAKLVEQLEKKAGGYPVLLITISQN